jgi:hypothetical protein
MNNCIFNDLNNQKQQFEETKTNNLELEYERKHQNQQLTPMNYEQEINKVNDENIQKNNQELSFSSSSNNLRSTDFSCIDLNLSENLTESSTSSVENEIMTQKNFTMYIAEPDRNDNTINYINQDNNYLQKVHNTFTYILTSINCYSIFYRGTY